MIDFYHEPGLGARALRVVALLTTLTLLGGCSISMPMTSFVDDRPTGSVTPAASDTSKVDVADARPADR